jgi:orotidine-5'-phosphate decarboxylase
MTEPFGRRLRDLVDERGPFCAGIDPHPSLLQDWGLNDDVAGLERFAMTSAEAVAGQVAVVKPQSAFFERRGSRGIAVLESMIEALRTSGTLVLLDAKRGDIGSTMQGYADAYLDQTSPLAVDAITVHPYLGFQSLRPALTVAQRNGAGVFVLALTSNPEAADVQAARKGGSTVAAGILAAIGRENAGVEPLGSVGAVVAANLVRLDESLDIGGPLLAPGLGSQGGTVADVRRIFAGVTDRVLPSSSRGVLAAGPDVGALRNEVRRVADTVAAGLDGMKG